MDNKEKVESTEENQTQEEESTNIQEEYETLKKEHLYLRAEFDNFRKQSIKERSTLLKFAGESIARDLLSILDVFEKALSTEINSENFTSFVDGVRLTKKELYIMLENHGIKEINCKGKPFDPNQAEALSQLPTTDVEEGHVYDVMRKGYLFHDKVLRHAQVVIATAPDEKS